jgi:hypothetical protein
VLHRGKRLLHMHVEDRESPHRRTERRSSWSSGAEEQARCCERSCKHRTFAKQAAFLRFVAACWLLAWAGMSGVWPAACASPHVRGCSSEVSACDVIGVYQAVLESQFVDSDSQCLVVRIGMSRWQFGRLETDLWSAFAAAQAEPAGVGKGVKASVPVVMLGPDDPMADMNWLADSEGFFTRYPGSEGVVELSGVGFDETRTRAMVAAYLGSGRIGGRGGFYELAKQDGRWRVVRVLGGLGYGRM